MAMTLRLSPTEDESLTRLARSFRTSKNLAAAKAIDIVAPKPDHTEFVRDATERLVARYSLVLARLADV
jgi:predicted transcriptional regulator